MSNSVNIVLFAYMCAIQCTYQIFIIPCICSILDNVQELYAFHYSPQEDKLVQSAGWQLYDITTEFHRMEIPGELWVESKINKEYKVFHPPPLFNHFTSPKLINYCFVIILLLRVYQIFNYLLWALSFI